MGRQRWGGNGGEANMGRPRVTRAIFTFGSAALAARPPFADPPAIAVCRGPAATNSDTSKPIDPWTAPGRIDDGVTGLGILSGNAVGAVVLGPVRVSPPGPDHLRNRGRAARRPRGPGDRGRRCCRWRSRSYLTASAPPNHAESTRRGAPFPACWHEDVIRVSAVGSTPGERPRFLQFGAFDALPPDTAPRIFVASRCPVLLHHVRWWKGLWWVVLRRGVRVASTHAGGMSSGMRSAANRISHWPRWISR